MVRVATQRRNCEMLSMRGKRPETSPSKYRAQLLYELVYCGNTPVSADLHLPLDTGSGHFEYPNVMQGGSHSRNLLFLKSCNRDLWTCPSRSIGATLEWIKYHCSNHDTSISHVFDDWTAGSSVENKVIYNVYDTLNILACVGLHC